MILKGFMAKIWPPFKAFLAGLLLGLERSLQLFNRATETRFRKCFSRLLAGAATEAVQQRPHVKEMTKATMR